MARWPAAMIHVLFAEGYADRAYMAKYADDPAGTRGACARPHAGMGGSITGVPVEEIRDFARLYGRTKRAFIRVGYGFSRARNGAVSSACRDSACRR